MEYTNKTSNNIYKTMEIKFNLYKVKITINQQGFLTWE